MKRIFRKKLGATLTRWLCAIALFASAMAFSSPACAGVRRKPSVLILHTTWFAGDTQAKLAATGLFSSVDLWNAAASGAGTPSLAQLLPYDAVLVSPDYSEVFADNVALGNNLADYVDAGGGVVCNSLAISTFSPPAGRWASGYQVITAGANPLYLSPQSIDFNSITDPNNLLFVGVGSFSGSSSPRAAQTTVNAGCTILARWTGGHVLAAASNTKARVDLNLFAPSSDVSAAFWNASTDGTKLIANSLLSVVRPRVALVATVHDWVPFESMAAALRNSRQFGTIDRINTRDVTPTLEQLSKYDAILLFTETYPNNATALGNVLADYVDLGRGVVAAARGLTGLISPGGRWASEFYAMSGSGGGVDGTFSPNFASHPITSGVAGFTSTPTPLTSPRGDTFVIATASNSFGIFTVVLGSTKQPNRVNLGWWFGGSEQLPSINQLIVNSLVYTIKPYIACVTSGLGFNEAVDVKSKLIATKRFSGVGLVLVASAFDLSPTLLNPFSGVLFWGTNPMGEQVETDFGNLLASFVDAGGGVVAAGDSLMTGGTRPRGRWISEGYDITPDAALPARITGAAHLGPAPEPEHPVNLFVRRFEGNYSGRQGATPLLRGRTLLRWSDGMMLASEHNFRRRVDVNFYPPSDSAVGGLWNHRTDGAWLLANAVDYTVHHTPCAGDFNGDGVVDDTDFTLFIAAYNELVDPRADLTGDGNTDDADFSVFVGSYDRLVCP